MTKVTDHMANERTYLAWVRTGITIMALGFVVAKFGIIIRELVPNAPATSYHLSSAKQPTVPAIGHEPHPPSHASGAMTSMYVRVPSSRCSQRSTILLSRFSLVSCVLFSYKISFII